MKLSIFWSLGVTQAVNATQLYVEYFADRNSARIVEVLGAKVD